MMPDLEATAPNERRRDRETGASLPHLRSAAFAAAANGVVISDARLPDNPIIDVNPSFLRMTGYDAGDVLGRNCRFLQGEETDPQAVARIRASIAAGEPDTVTLLNYRRDGEPFLNELHIAPIRDEGGDITHFVGIQNDVSERVRANRLESALAAEREAARLKDVFLATMSHELRTPLTVVLGYADLLADSGALGAEQVEDARAIASGVLRMLRVVDDILDMTAIAGGHVSVRREPVDIGEIVVDVARDAAAAATRNVELRCSRQEGACVVLGDAERIRQIATILVGNAVKFTPEGSIDVQVRTLADGSVELAVSDTGIGIAEDALPHIFEPFRQADRGSTRSHGGLGLGLPIASALASLLGASLRAESEHGRGSTFVLAFPPALDLAQDDSAFPSSR